MDVIIENCLLLGNYKTANDLKILKTFGITHILVYPLFIIFKLKVVGYELDCLFKENFEYLKIEAKDEDSF